MKWFFIFLIIGVICLCIRDYITERQPKDPLTQQIEAIENTLIGSKDKVELINKLIEKHKALNPVSTNIPQDIKHFSRKDVQTSENVEKPLNSP